MAEFRDMAMGVVPAGRASRLSARNHVRALCTEALPPAAVIGAGQASHDAWAARWTWLQGSPCERANIALAGSANQLITPSPRLGVATGIDPSAGAAS